MRIREGDPLEIFTGAGEEIAICDDCYKEMNGLIGG